MQKSMNSPIPIAITDKTTDSPIPAPNKWNT